MSEVDLSIIIPVYNGEKYIKRCIYSIAKTENISYEIIVINDCSNDNSKSIIKECKSVISNIIFIDLSENLGVSKCRNIGIERANGKYITFVDIDDYIEKNMYETLVTMSNKYSLDTCGCTYREIEEKSNKITKSKYKNNGDILNKKQALKDYLTDKISPAIWDKIYKKEIINKIRFDEKLKIGEDILFCLNVFLNCNNVCFINEYYYNYIQQDKSAMHNLSDNVFQFLKIEENIDVIDNQFLKNNFPEEFEFFKDEMFLRVIHSISNSNIKEIKKTKKYLKKVYSKVIVTRIIANKYTNKFVRLEMIILKYFGINIHLVLSPFYKVARNIIRK